MFSKKIVGSFLLLQIFVVFQCPNGNPINQEAMNSTLSPINETGIVFRRCIQNGTIAITFDDGPRPGQTERIISLLQEKNVPTTFFVVGLGHLDNDEGVETLKRTAASGQEIGHHTWSHANMSTLNESSIFQEMNRMTYAIKNITGKTPKRMRPPYGEYNDQVIRIVHDELGFPLILWSIDTNDWRHPGNTEAGLAEYKAVLNGTDPATTPGFIALHHDPYVGSYELAEACIDYVRSIGYGLVSLDECLGTYY